MKQFFLLLILAPACIAQPAFEVASIHPDDSGAVMLIKANPGGTLSGVDVPLTTLIRVAYRVANAQISGPVWIDNARFSIAAKGAPEDLSLAVMAPKIRSLLAERFGLKVHTVNQMRTALILADGSHIVPSEGGDGILHLSRTGMAGRNIAMDEFARGLSDVTGDIYVDRTGFQGKFDVPDFRWSVSPSDLSSQTGSIATELKEKFGIELKSQKVSVPMLVVDHIEKTPTDN